MNARDLILRLHEHRDWVNRILMRIAGQLSNDQLHRQFPIGQGTVWQSLTHLYGGEYVWLEALLGNPEPIVPGDLPRKLPGNQEGPGSIESVAELKDRWLELERRWTDYLFQLDPDSLEDIVHKVSTSSGFGKRHGTLRSDVLLHVCTHSQYTTAQIVNMLRHLGVDELPDVMLISLARKQRAGEELY